MKNKSKISRLLILAFWGTAQWLSAQEISGVIVDSLSKEPLFGINVMLPNGYESHGITDINGVFTVSFPNYSFDLIIAPISHHKSKIIPIKHQAGNLILDTILLSLKSYLLLNNQVVVTAQRKEDQQYETMESVAVLTGEQILANGSRSMAEAMMGTPGVWMQKTNHGGGSPFIRGLTGNQTLLLLDGIRLNNSTYRYGPNQYFNTIDPLNVEQVEVVRGTGAVLYGSDALGGAIQVLTKAAKFNEYDNWRYQGEVLGRILSNDMEQGGRATISAANDRVALRAGLSYRDFGDLLAGGDLGVLAPSAYQELGLDWKGLFKLGKRAVLTTAYNGLFQSNVGRYDQVAQRGYQSYQFNPQNRQLAYLKLEQQSQKTWLDLFKAVLSYQNSLEGREKQKENSPLLAEEEDRVHTIGFLLEGESTIQKNWTTLTGLDYYYDKVYSSDQDRNLETGELQINRGLYPDGAEAHNIALFNSHSFTWNKWQVQAGWRLNLIHLNIADATFGNTSISPLALVGNLSTRYQINPTQGLIASINTGFRAPNINDLSSFGNFDFGIEVPTKDLSPERSLTYELTYKVKTRSFASNLTLYHTQLLNLIGRVPGTFQGESTYQENDVYVKENIGKSFIQGIEVDAEQALGRHWLLSASLNYTYGQNTDEDEPMRRIPPLFTRTALQYQYSRWSVQTEWLAAARQDRLSGGDISDHRIAAAGTPAWNVLNFRMAYRFNEKFQVRAGINNLFDEAYRMHGSGVDGMGRSFWLSGAWGF
jgi:outer membrane cobalamin receptor